jgi:membrane-associated protease RseP (regulator of RpoE activity)
MRSFLSALIITLLSAGTLQAQSGALGVTLRENPAGGVSIENVFANSPAAQIGLKAGDRILSINNQVVAHSDDVVRMIGSLPPNTVVDLWVARGAWRGNLKAALGSTTNVFRPNQEFVRIAPRVPVVPPAGRASTPMMFAPGYFENIEEWQFPRNMFDNGRRGMMAAYGGLGY